MSVQAILLLVLAALAIWPAQYLFRHMREAPHRRETSLSALAYKWRRPYKALLGTAALVFLAGTFTWVTIGDAEDRAFERVLIGLVLGAVAIPLVMHIASGLRHHRIKLHLTLWHEEVERGGHPFLFWLEIAMSVLIVLGFLIAASKLWGP